MAIFKNKKRITSILLAVLFGLVMSFFMPTLYTPHALAGSFLPLPDDGAVGLPTAEGDTAVDKFENVLGPVTLTVRVLVGAIAIVLIVISGFTMTLGADNESTVKTQKTSMTYAIMGLMMISIAGPLAEVFDYRQGNALKDGDALVSRAAVFDDTVKLIITFIKYLLGALATLMFIRAGATMVSSSANEEDIGREKKNLALGAGGLLMVFASDLIVRKVLYSAAYNTSTSETVVTINQNEFVRQLVAITNIIITFVGPIMVLGIVIAGLLYVTAGGDEGRIGMAKNILKNSIIGVIVIYGAFALVSSVISGIF